MPYTEPAHTVTRTDGTPVQVGDPIKVDNNLHATFLGVDSLPFGDDEDGEWYPAQVRVRFSYGAEEVISENRAGLLVNEV